jgi:hypothetical protein
MAEDQLRTPQHSASPRTASKSKLKRARFFADVGLMPAIVFLAPAASPYRAPTIQDVKASTIALRQQAIQAAQDKRQRKKEYGLHCAPLFHYCDMTYGDQMNCLVALSLTLSMN